MTQVQASAAQAPTALPLIARVLGFAGLIPQAAALAILVFGSPRWHLAAIWLGHAYAALILSFLGGLWWGLAAGRIDRSPKWVWAAAVAPSLIAFATIVPPAVGAASPRSSLVVLGVSLIISLRVDRQLVADGLAPAWWMTLRLPLSMGLGLFTVAVAAVI